MADDTEAPTVAEISAQLRALVAQTHLLVGEIDEVVGTLHGHSESMQEQAETFERDEGSERHG